MSVYDPAFVTRVFDIVHRVENEGMPPEFEDSAERILEKLTRMLDGLYEKRRAAFLAIMQHISDRLGLGPIQTLDESGLEQVIRDTDEATSAWEDHDLDHPDGAAPATSDGLQRLLSKHLEICELIGAIQDEAAGLGETGRMLH